MIRWFLHFQAERIKWRRSWASALAVIAPLSQVLFMFIFYWFLEDRADPTGPGFLAWYQVNGNGWNLFFMPITVALIASISWDTEEMSGGRKHFFVQPCSTTAHYIVKLASHLALVILSQIVFFGMLVLCGIALRRYVPTLDMGTLQLKMLWHLASASLFASLPLVALHTWVSSKFKGLLTCITFAVAGSLITSQMADGTTLVYLSPWGMAAQTVAISNGSQGGGLGLLGASMVITVSLAVLGTLDFYWRGKSFS